MTADVVLVRPRPGLILDGIPAEGAEIPRLLAEEWIADRLVVAVQTTQAAVSATTERAGPRPAQARKRKESST